MSAAAALLAEARATGAELALRDGRVCLRGPCPASLRERLRAARDELGPLLSTDGDTGDGDTRPPGGPITGASVAAGEVSSWRRGDAPPESCGPYSRHAGPWRRRRNPPGPWVCERCHPPGPGTEGLGPWVRRPAAPDRADGPHGPGPAPRADG